MWKRISGLLDTVLSFIGLATLVVIGVRFWRKLPILPTNLFSEPPAAIAPAPKSRAAPPKSSPRPQAAPRTAQATAIAMAPTAQPAATPTPSPTLSPAAAPRTDPTASPALKMAHDWGREVSVTVNASRYVKSLSDLAPPAASLPSAARLELKAAQAKTRGFEMLLVCNVTIQYSGNEEVTLDQSGFRLVSPDRQIFPAVACPFSTGDLQPLRATVLANGSARGDLVFPVRRGVQADEVIYQP